MGNDLPSDRKRFVVANDFESNTPYAVVLVFERSLAHGAGFSGVGTLVRLHVGGNKYSVALLTHKDVLKPDRKYILPFYNVTDDGVATSNESFSTLDLSGFENGFRRDPRSPLVAVFLTGFLKAAEGRVFIRELSADMVEHSKTFEADHRYFTVGYCGDFQTLASALGGKKIVDLNPSTGLDESQVDIGLLNGGPVFRQVGEAYTLAGVMHFNKDKDAKHLKHVLINAARVKAFIEHLQLELYQGQKSIQFGVQDDSGHCSHSWILKLEGSDVYLSQTATRRALHISLHKSGQYHLRFDAHFLAQYAPDSKLKDASHVLKWEPYYENAGLVHALLIYVPRSSVALVPDSSADVRRVPQAPLGQSVEFSVLVQKREYVTSECPRQHDSESVGYLDMPNGDRTWVSYKNAILPDEMRFQPGNSTRFYNGDISDDEQVGILLWGKTKAGVAFIFEGKMRADQISSFV